MSRIFVQCVQTTENVIRMNRSEWLLRDGSTDESRSDGFMYMKQRLSEPHCAFYVEGGQVLFWQNPIAELVTISTSNLCTVRVASRKTNVCMKTVQTRPESAKVKQATTRVPTKKITFNLVDFAVLNNEVSDLKIYYQQHV